MTIRKFLALGAMISVFAAGPADAAEIAAYEALYRVALKDLRIEGFSESAKGVIEYRLSRDCYHWSVDRRLEFKLKFTDGRQTHLVIVERYREALNGRFFWFWTRTTVNGATGAIISGTAVRPEPDQQVEIEAPKEEKKEPGPKKEGPTLEEIIATPEQLAIIEAKREAEEAERKKNEPEQTDAPDAEPAAASTDDAAPSPEDEVVAAGDAPKEDGDASKDNAGEPKEMRLLGTLVQYDWPNTLEMEIPPEVDAIFPITAVQAQLDALATDGLQPRLTVFDGTSPTGPHSVQYKTARAAKAAAGKPKGNPELLDSPSWRYTARYLPHGEKKANPVRIVTVRRHQNGVVSEMLLDLGPFSLKADLAWVKAVSVPNCE